MTTLRRSSPLCKPLPTPTASGSTTAAAGREGTPSSPTSTTSTQSHFLEQTLCLVNRGPMGRYIYPGAGSRSGPRRARSRPLCRHFLRRTRLIRCLGETAHLVRRCVPQVGLITRARRESFGMGLRASADLDIGPSSRPRGLGGRFYPAYRECCAIDYVRWSAYPRRARQPTLGTMAAAAYVREPVKGPPRTAPTTPLVSQAPHSNRRPPHVTAPEPARRPHPNRRPPHVPARGGGWGGWARRGSGAGRYGGG